MGRQGSPGIVSNSKESYIEAGPVGVGGTFVLPLPPLPQESVAAAALESIASEEDFGDLLVSLVALARERGIDAEAAGRGASRRLVERIRAVEAQ